MVVDAARAGAGADVTDSDIDVDRVASDTEQPRNWDGEHQAASVFAPSNLNVHDVNSAPEKMSLST